MYLILLFITSFGINHEAYIDTLDFWPIIKILLYFLNMNPSNNNFTCVNLGG